MNLTNQIASERSKRAKVIGGGIILLLLTFLAWVQNGRSTAQTAHALYLSGDCYPALLLFEEVGEYPSFLDLYDSQEHVECLSFWEAQLSENDGPLVAIPRYESFLNTYNESPLTTPALAAIHRLYIDWAGAKLERGTFRDAITILEKATADYPALEAETEERLLQTYLAWGAARQSAGHTDQAITVYEELQRRYPQFTAEAQAAITALKNE